MIKHKITIIILLLLLIIVPGYGSAETASDNIVHQGISGDMKRDSISLLMVWGLQTNLIGSNGKKNLPAMQENWVRSLGQEDPLEKGIATHASILTWRIPWTKEPGGLQCEGLQSWT